MIRLTPCRRAWLELLAEKGPRERDHTTTGFYCHQAGWTEWNYRFEGRDMTMDEARECVPEPFWENARAAGERITEAGLAKLKEQVP
jgi:hypothetical protein